MPADDLTIRAYDPAADEAAVLALMGSSLGWTDDPFFPAFFRWKHHDGPWGPSPAWVATEGDRIVGFRAMMRWAFDRDGRTITAVRAVDTATDPEHRGRGIFRTLTLHAVEQLTADGVDLVFNTPNDQSRPGYLTMGWEALGPLPVRMRPVSAARLPRIARARTGADLRSVPTSLGVPAIEAVHRAVDPGCRGLRTVRSEEFLRWRYGLDGLHYRALVGKHGIVVFRLRRRGSAVECVVADLLVRDQIAASSAMRYLVRHVDADYLIGLGTDRLSIGGIPVPGQGPMLTWRPLASSWRPQRRTFCVSMGDIELF